VENFFRDNEDIQFYLKHLDLDRIIELWEADFRERDLYPYAPKDVADAKESYEKILEIIGEIAAEHLAPYAAEVDREGVAFKDGVVTYPKPISDAMKLLAKADLMGFRLPRKYGGLNVPATIMSMAAEVMCRADGSFLNFGLQQDIAETIAKFASEEQKAKYLPMLASGAVTAAMVLTEPEAGSDLQAVSLRAHLGEDGRWYLNGVKRFITNGCGELSLVLARSEEGTKGGKGLSLFLYTKDEHMKVRRIEEKLGIHGSATCELQFTNAPAELMGERKRGLSRYTMWLMNSARLGIAGQALGIAEAAYREADAYARKRIQFKKPIREMIPVAEMLTEMKVAIEAGRTLFYETSRVVDIKESLEHLAEMHPERVQELQYEINTYTGYAALMTPIVKAYNTEMANRVAYDAIQIHGGTGYMKEFNAERHYRDARITNIYEGTTQLQVLAAVGQVTAGTAMERLNEYDEEDYAHAPELLAKVRRAKNALEKTVAVAKGKDDPAFVDYHSRRLVEMATDVFQAYLLLRDARYAERKKKVAEIFIDKMLPRVEMNMRFIVEGEASLLKHYRDIIG
jgi:3-(methylthio)propanoyl-CoA dehydrogenase